MTMGVLFCVGTDTIDAERFGFVAELDLCFAGRYLVIESIGVRFWMKGNVMKKKIVLLSIIVLSVLVGCGSKYKTSLSWAEQGGYTCAVEIDGFNGEVMKAGTYTAQVGHTSGNPAGIYDVYIESHEINNKADLSEPDFTVGGTENAPVQITLNKGDYLAIVPYTDLYYTPSGYFEMKLN